MGEQPLNPPGHKPPVKRPVPSVPTASDAPADWTAAVRTRAPHNDAGRQGLLWRYTTRPRVILIAFIAGAMVSFPIGMQAGRQKVSKQLESKDAELSQLHASAKALRQELASLKAQRTAEPPPVAPESTRMLAPTKPEPVNNAATSKVTMQASAQVGTIRIIRFGEKTKTRNAYLIIGVTITNNDSARKVDYVSPRNPDLRDDVGNRYKPIVPSTFGEIVGRVGSASIYPGKSIHDVLVFEPPVDRQRRLWLTIDGKSVGSAGQKFEIVIDAASVMWE